MKKIVLNIVILFIGMGITCSDVKGINDLDRAFGDDRSFGDNSLWDNSLGGGRWAGENSVLNDAWDGVRDMFGEQQGVIPRGNFALPDPKLFNEVGYNTELRAYILKIVNFWLAFLGIVAVAFVIYAGFLYVTAGGEDGQHEKAKKIVLYASMGIIVILASFALVNTVITSGLSGKEGLPVCENGIIEYPEDCEHFNINNPNSGPILARRYGGEWPEGSDNVCPYNCRFASHDGGGGENGSGGGGGIINGTISVKNSGEGPFGYTADYGPGAVVSLTDAQAGISFISSPATSGRTWMFSDGTQDESEETVEEHSITKSFYEERSYEVGFFGATEEGDVVRASKKLIVGGVEPDIYAKNTNPIISETITLDAGRSRVKVGAITDYAWACTQTIPAGGAGCFADTSGSDKKKVNVSFSEVGEYEVVLTIIPTVGPSGVSEAYPFVVKGNTPLADFVYSQIDPANSPTRYRFDASRSLNIDGEARGLSYDWEITKNSTPVAELEGKVVTYDFASGGTYNVELIVKEYHKGEYKEDSDPQTIAGVTTLGIDFKKPVPVLLENQEFTFRAEGISRDDEEVTLTWAFGSFDEEGETYAPVVLDPLELKDVRAYYPHMGGPYNITLTADKTGETSLVVDKNIYVRRDGAYLSIPVVTVTPEAGEARDYYPPSEALPSIHRVLDTIEFASESIDENGAVGDASEIMDETWSVDGNVVPIGRLANEFTEVKNYLVSLKASRKGNPGLGDTKVFNINVENVNPEVTTLTWVDLGENNNLGAFPVSAEADDPDTGVISSYRFDVLDANNANALLDRISTEEPEALFNLNQFAGNRSFRFAVTAIDADGGEGYMRDDARTLDIVVEDAANSEPRGELIILSNNGSPNGSPDTEFRFQVNAIDDERDHLTYEWYIGPDDGAGGFDYERLIVAGTTTIITRQFQTLGTYGVYVNVLDGRADPVPVPEEPLVITIADPFNNPPRGELLIVSNNGSPNGYPDTDFVFRVNAIDDDRHPLTYAWFVDGEEQILPPNTTNISRRFDVQQEPHTVQVQVSDGRMEAPLNVPENPLQINVSVEGNDPPRGELLIVSNDGSPNGTPDTNFMFRVNALDDDQDQLSYTWTIDGEELILPDHTVNVSRRFDIEGSPHSVLVQVSDGQGHNIFLPELDNPLQITVAEEGNVEPRGELLIVSNNGLAEGTSETDFVFRVNAIDDDQDPLTYDWFVDGEHLPIPDSTTSISRRFEVLEEGFHTVLVQVSDGQGHTLSLPGVDNPLQITVVEEGNVEPRGELLIVSNNGSPEGTPETDFVFRVNAVDDDQDPLTYAWYVNGNQLVVPNTTTSVTRRFNILGEGEDPHSVRVRVSDGQGHNIFLPGPEDNDVMEIDISLEGNNDPRGELLIISNNGSAEGYPDTQFIFRVNAVDDDGDRLTYAWFIDNEQLILPNSTNTITRWFEAEEYDILVRVSDGRGGTTYLPGPGENDPLVITVAERGNYRPVGELLVTPDSLEGTPDTDFRFRVNAIDHDQDRLTYVWLVDGNPLPLPNTTTSLTRRFDVLGEGENPHTVQVQVSDGIGDPVDIPENPLAISISEPGNNDPIGELLIVSNNGSPEGTSETNFRFQVNAIDDDQDRLTYNWFIDGVRVAVPNATTSLSRRFDVPEEGGNPHTVQVQVSDGRGGNVSVPVEPLVITIAEPGNNNPIGELVILSNNGSPEGNPDTEFRFRVNAIDDDNDRLTYNWFIDGERLAVPNTTTSLTRTFDVPGEGENPHTVQVQISDGRGGNVSVPTAPLAIIITEMENDTIPRGELLLVSNDGSPEGTPDTEFRFRVNAVDDDRDRLTYAWFVNGLQLPLPNNTIYTTRQFGVGTHTIYVAVSDGRGGNINLPTEPLTITITEQGNSIPRGELSIVSNNGSPNGTPDTNFNFRVAAVDDDQDRLTYSWFVDGTQLAVSQTTTSIIRRFEDVGDYRILVQVSDGNGGDIDIPPAEGEEGEAGLVVTIAEEGNTLPRAELEILSNNGSPEGSPDTEFRLRVNAIDDDRDPLTYEWYVGTDDGEGNFDYERLIVHNNTMSISRRFPVGNHDVKVAVSDGRAEAVDVHLGLTIEVAPIFADFITPISPIEVEEAYTFRSSSPGALSYAWTFPPEATVSTPINIPVVTAYFRTSGQHNVILTVNSGLDDENVITKPVYVYEVGDVNAVIETQVDGDIIVDRPLEINQLEADNIALFSRSTDEEGDEPEGQNPYGNQENWYVNNNSVDDIAEYDFTGVRDYRVRLDVRSLLHPNDVRDSAEVIIRVVNQSPEIQNVNVAKDPDNITRAMVTVGATDADGEVTEYDYQVIIEGDTLGNPIPSNQSSQIFLLDDLIRAKYGDDAETDTYRFTFRVTVEDDDGAVSDPVTSNSYDYNYINGQ